MAVFGNKKRLFGGAKIPLKVKFVKIDKTQFSTKFIPNRPTFSHIYVENSVESVENSAKSGKSYPHYPQNKCGKLSARLVKSFFSKSSKSAKCTNCKIIKKD
jgi:hypothetical protein